MACTTLQAKLAAACVGLLLQNSIRSEAMAENCRIHICPHHSMQNSIVLAKRRLNVPKGLNLSSSTVSLPWIVQRIGTRN